MRLDFNVLWVDDQPARVDAQIRSITKRMGDEGFNFSHQLCQSLGDVAPLIADTVFTDEIDLILVDWDLGHGVHGEDAIAQIREAVPYKDVVFYSAQNPAQELRKAAFEAGLEGVYCASRDELVDEVMGVFDSLVKKVLDLDHMRGIVMGATSDIDYMVNECLVVLHGKMDDPGRATLMAKALEYIERRIGELTTVAEKLRGATSMAALFEAHLVFTANDRLRLLAGVLSGDNPYAAYRDSVVSYQQKVVPDRNMLGHIVLVPKGKPQAVVDAQGKEIGIEEMRDLRRLILGLRTDFRRLMDALAPLPATGDDGTTLGS